MGGKGFYGGEVDSSASCSHLCTPLPRRFGRLCRRTSRSGWNTLPPNNSCLRIVYSVFKPTIPKPKTLKPVSSRLHSDLILFKLFANLTTPSRINQPFKRAPISFVPTWAILYIAHTSHLSVVILITHLLSRFSISIPNLSHPGYIF